MKHISNSKRWWDHYFRSNWLEKKGDEQTDFFSRLALKYLPEWIIKDIKTRRLGIVNMGCAEGQGVFRFSKFFNKNSITGLDFSQKAIDNATKKFPDCKFVCEDIKKNRIDYDVVYTSNVLEHFPSPLKIIKMLLAHTKNYLVILVPFQEEKLHEQHAYSFDYDSFPLFIDRFSLVCSTVIDTSIMKPTYWQGQQILVVYASRSVMDKAKGTLASIVRNDIFQLETQIKRYKSEIKGLNEEIKKIYSGRLFRMAFLYYRLRDYFFKRG